MRGAKRSTPGEAKDRLPAPQRQHRWVLGLTAGLGLLLGLLSLVSVRSAKEARHLSLPSTARESSAGATQSAGSPRSTNAALDEELKRAWQELDEGRIAYTPKQTMSQGQVELVEVRVSQDPTVDLVAGLDGAIVEEIKTSGSMVAYLDGAPEDFAILPLSSAQQALVGSSTAWLWEVTPLRSGQKALTLRVLARLRLSSGEAEQKDVLVKRTTIQVAVSPVWVTKRFVGAYWQWLIGGPMAGLVAWIGGRYFRKKKPPAGL